MNTIEIKKVNTKWLINGKPYVDLSEREKRFFDEFIIAMRINFGAEKYDKQKVS